MPVVIYFEVLSLIAWHSYHLTIRFIMSVPRHDYAKRAASGVSAQVAAKRPSRGRDSGCCHQRGCIIHTTSSCQWRLGNGIGNMQT
jgi:hypothetical protein